MSAAGARIYLDHNAATPLLPEARAALLDALDHFGNPSSVHREGQTARGIIDKARRAVALLVGAKPDAVTFTSGATEAAVTCLSPRWIVNGAEVLIDRLAVVETDHPSIREGGRFQAEACTRLPVDANGVLRLNALEAWLSQVPDGPKSMVAISWANSETGVLQPLAEIAESCRAAGALLVADAVQVAGRLPIDLKNAGADAVILSGHKIGAAKGTGAFVLREATCRPEPLITGGGQEKYRRSGTEAVPVIASFGAAALVAAERVSQAPALAELRDHLEDALLQRFAENITIVGKAAPRLANTSAVSCRKVQAETAQIALDLAGIAVSSGSACSSGKVGASHVLEALCAAGCPVDARMGALRVSLGYETRTSDIDALVTALEPLLLRAAQGKSSGRAAA
ncbi:cysteine desulfurase family protein [Consotaella salsifontis]|uniref:Cysteine desulfurase n=1 Tax=Consotaella salsifontis TaxID=1365950 RepID=A0A1T4LRS4_9HYPH|nr:cysteine desulfurase family protein [Consotaella salsifontis]SJZ57228.1 cysteine desulfurase [Consotaella salsifontis]